MSQQNFAMQSIIFTSVMRLEYRVSIVEQPCNDGLGHICQLIRVGKQRKQSK